MSKTIEEIVAPTRIFDTDTGMTIQMREDIEQYARDYAVSELEGLIDMPYYVSMKTLKKSIDRLKGKESHG